MLMADGSKQLNTSETSEVLYSLGYRWSNEAQCYYSTDFLLPCIKGAEGHILAQRIIKNYERCD